MHLVGIQEGKTLQQAPPWKAVTPPTAPQAEVIASSMCYGGPSRYRLMQKHLCGGLSCSQPSGVPPVSSVGVRDSEASSLVTEGAGT